MSSDVGPVTSDDLGVQGEVIIRAARLLEAAALRKAMVRDRANLGVVVSPFVFDTAIGQPGGPIDSAGFCQDSRSCEGDQPAGMDEADRSGTG